MLDFFDVSFKIQHVLCKAQATQFEDWKLKGSGSRGSRGSYGSGRAWFGTSHFALVSAVRAFVRLKYS